MVEKLVGVKIEFPSNLISERFYEPFGKFVIDLVYDECTVEVQSLPSEKPAYYLGPIIIRVLCKQPDRGKLRRRAEELKEKLQQIHKNIRVSIVKVKRPGRKVC